MDWKGSLNKNKKNHWVHRPCLTQPKLESQSPLHLMKTFDFNKLKWPGVPASIYLSQQPQTFTSTKTPHTFHEEGDMPNIPFPHYFVQENWACVRTLIQFLMLFFWGLLSISQGYRRNEHLIENFNPNTHKISYALEKDYGNSQIELCGPFQE